MEQTKVEFCKECQKLLKENNFRIVDVNALRALSIHRVDVEFNCTMCHRMWKIGEKEKHRDECLCKLIED